MIDFSSSGASPTRRAGVIAAGRGERLREAIGALKPLVPVSGRPLIERVLSSIAETAPSQVAVIVNDDSRRVREVVDQRCWPFDLEWIVETTPSSMHSFLRVIETLAQDGHPGPFLLSTVDTVAARGTYRAFAACAAAMDADLVLAVNRPQPDDNPLLVRVEGEPRPEGTGGAETAGGRVPTRGDAPARGDVRALGETVSIGDPGVYATAGIYMVRPTVLAAAEEARADGLGALRLFLQRLVRRGYRVAALEVPDSIDVDRAEDVHAAEALLRSARA